MSVDEHPRYALAVACLDDMTECASRLLEGWQPVVTHEGEAQWRKPGSPPEPIGSEYESLLAISWDDGHTANGRHVMLSNLENDGSWQIAHESEAGGLTWIRYTPKHHLASVANDSAVYVFARPMEAS